MLGARCSYCGQEQPADKPCWACQRRVEKPTPPIGTEMPVRVSHDPKAGILTCDYKPEHQVELKPEAWQASRLMPFGELPVPSAIRDEVNMLVSCIQAAHRKISDDLNLMNPEAALDFMMPPRGERGSE